MRIFLTGATGFIGSKILPELQERGHEVIGMTRSDAGAEALARAGARAHHATLEDPASVAAGAAQADAVIHTAFDHDFTRFAENCEKERHVLRALGAELMGSDRKLMVTSGAAMGDPGDGGPAREDVLTLNGANPRRVSEQVVAELLEAGINASVMRLPQVHDDHRQGLITPYIAIALRNRAVGYVGDGRNRFAAAHVRDVAALYALAFEHATPGARYHAVDEEAVTLRDIAAVISAGLNLPLISVRAEDAADHFGWFAEFAKADMPASSALTRAQLGWRPTGPDLLSDLRALDYSAFTAH